MLRDVSAGATGATKLAPKFSDILTLSQPEGGRFCPPSQRLNLNLHGDYVPDAVNKHAYLIGIYRFFPLPTRTFSTYFFFHDFLQKSLQKLLQFILLLFL